MKLGKSITFSTNGGGVRGFGEGRLRKSSPPPPPVIFPLTFSRNGGGLQAVNKIPKNLRAKKTKKKRGLC